MKMRISRKAEWLFLLTLCLLVIPSSKFSIFRGEGLQKFSPSGEDNWQLPEPYLNSLPGERAQISLAGKLSRSLSFQGVGFSTAGIGGILTRSMGIAGTDLLENDPGDVLDDGDFFAFLQDVINGDGGSITGVYVKGVLRLRVVQQPSGDLTYVSDDFGTATQFRSPQEFGVVGLLAHNYLSGKDFLSIFPGLEIRLVYGDGTYQRYRVAGLADFERLTRYDVHSDFRDLQTHQILTSTEMFTRFYTGENSLTLQTCLEKDGYFSWGVRMISAEPIHPGS